MTINRRDLAALPAPSANLLWRNLRVRDIHRENGKSKTQNIRIEVEVTGESAGREWRCGLEFDFANSESFYVRPLREATGARPSRPEEASGVRVAFLPPMSGLAAHETKIEMRAIRARLGEGRTAEVLRNLCFQVFTSLPEEWQKLRAAIEGLFGVILGEPEYVSERGEIVMSYRDSRSDNRRMGQQLDLSSSGRGLQQTLLLLSFLALHPGSVLLLDEPDAHLEILQQREIFERLQEAARRRDSQLIIASHSEVVMNEAHRANPGSVIALLGRPHIVTRQSSLHRALTDVRFDQYYLAEQTGWVLYLESASDLKILQAFAIRLGHPVQNQLTKPFVHYIGNQPNRGREHFDALVEAKDDLVGILIVDRIDKNLEQRPALVEYMWTKREVENYLCHPETLINYARSLIRGEGQLLDPVIASEAEEVMRRTIARFVAPAYLENLGHSSWSEVKASDDLLDRVLPAFARELRVDPLRKADYSELVPHIPEDRISNEVTEVLHLIQQVARQARPAG